MLIVSVSHLSMKHNQLMKERVALYERVSTEEQARHGLSLAEQDKALTEYAEANKMQIVDRYIDAGISARKSYKKRPELLRLLQDVEQDKINVILFIKLDRWFRNVGDYYEVQKILDEHHVAWRATLEDYETVTASGRFKVNIMLSVAQDEADRTSERIKFVFDGKRERGESLGGRPPRGYIWVEHQLQLDPVEAPLIRKVFDIFLETGSAARTIERVPELHLSITTISYILRNVVYIGRHNNADVPAIITQEEYERVQSMLKKQPRKTRNHHVYLFSGLLKCPFCGHRMRAHSHGANGYAYYDCYNHAIMAGCKNNKCYREDLIEEYLLSHIDTEVDILIHSKNAEKAVSHQKERDSINHKLSRLSDLYINDMIDMQEYQKRRIALEEDLAAVPEDVAPVDVQKLKTTFFPDWQTLYRDLSSDGKAKFWRQTIKSISISKDGSISFSLF